jgi:hypothetical protein
MFGSTNAIAQAINNQNVTINENGVSIPEKNYTGFGIVRVEIAGSSTDNTKTFSQDTVLEKMNEILYSSTTKTDNIAKDILNTEITSEENEEDTSIWKYNPKNIAEYYQNILTCDNLYVQNKLNSILGEI